jgi:hypothetical protein
VWILQTFVRLRIAGAPVQLVERPPDAGLVVTHADHFSRLLAEARSQRDLVIVVARSDRGPQPLADFGIVQNPADADDYQFFIPSWLQPGPYPTSARAVLDYRNRLLLRFHQRAGSGTGRPGLARRPALARSVLGHAHDRIRRERPALSTAPLERLLDD